MKKPPGDGTGPTIRADFKENLVGRVPSRGEQDVVEQAAKMKTVSLVASLSRKAGGLFESVRRLHQCLAEIPTVNVSILGLEDEFSAADRPAWEPLHVESLRIIGPAQFGYSPGLGKKLTNFDADVVHVHGVWMYPSVAALNWHRNTLRPYLISAHGMLDPWAIRNSAWKKRLAKLLYEEEHLRNSACLRALCQSEADSIRTLGLRNPICIIPNGIDLPVVGLRDDRATGPQDHPVSGQWSVVSGLKAEGRRVLLYLGRLHPKKGLVNLIEAWAQIQRSEVRGQRSEGWLLAIAGWDQGGHEAELKRLCGELGVPFADVRDRNSEIKGQVSNVGNHGPNMTSDVRRLTSVLFLGPQFGEAKADCYANCDAFILPSFSEGLPMVVLEAWAYGKPVLMTPQCNLPEGFASNAAIHIEPTVESISEGLRSLLRAPASTLDSLGKNGRALVATRFTWPKIATEMKSVYDWVLGGGPKPACVI